MRTIEIVRKMFLFYASFSCLCLIHVTTGKLDSSPEVQTPLGRVQGQWKDSYDGRRYAAYQGIPYAKPPIGELRFEEPEPVQPWVGTWNATQSYVCVQNVMDFTQIAGSEDCLYIDVFVPSTDKNDLDVVVHIHGGGFMFGNSQAFINPKYVMDRDIILVSLNYRLGPLGFLSTQDEVVPGNNGLKDQVLALKWVQSNIASFGGNPNSVTLTGFSAGAASVHLHYFSPLSKGLFQRGMSISGTALNGWALTNKAAKNAKKLARLVGCPDSNNRDLKSCLKSRPATLLLKKVTHVYDYPPAPLTLFCPVIEGNNSKNPFIDEHPLSILNAKKVIDVPWIASVCRDEGQPLGILLLGLLDLLDTRWEEIGHLVLHNDNLFQRTDLLNKLKRFYLGEDGKFTIENYNVFAKMITDTMFVVDAEYAAKLQSEATKSPVYFYYFNYDQGTNTLMGTPPHLKLSGVPHGQDMIYLFGGEITKELSDSDVQLKNAFLDMLSQYAKYGVPTFANVDWKPTNGEKLTYLNITNVEDIKLQTTSQLSAVGKLWRQGLSSEELKDEL